MPTATKLHTSYIPPGDRVDRYRHDIDASVGNRIYDSIREEFDELSKLSAADFSRVVLQRRDAILDLPESQRFNSHEADDVLSVRTALSSAPIVETFSTIVGDTMQTASLAEPDTTLGWTVEQNAVNFLPATIFTLESEARLEKQTKGRPAHSISFGTKGQSWGIARYAGRFVVDETNMLDGQHVGAVLLGAAQVAAAAYRLRPDLVYALLLGNPTLTADNLALFHATHANLASGGGSAFSATSLDTAIGAVGLQHLTDEHGDPIHSNLSAKYLMVPPQLVGSARRTVRNMLCDDDAYEVRQESRLSALGVVNPKTNTIATGSATNWLLAAPGGSRPSIVVGGLNGSLVPKVSRWSLDRGQWGLVWDVAIDIGAAAIDYRGVYYSVGA